MIAFVEVLARRKARQQRDASPAQGRTSDVADAARAHDAANPATPKPPDQQGVAGTPTPRASRK